MNPFLRTTLIFFLLLVPACVLQAQPVDTLPNPYRQGMTDGTEMLYFVPATGTVETQKGRVILKPGLFLFAAEENVPEIELPRTFFDLIDTASRERAGNMRFSYSFCTFNNRGDLLYHPFWFDNGADYWAEGRRRIVENDKMGMVNRLGQRTVPVRDYTFISPMRGGYSIGCRDCKYTIFDSSDQEHGTGYAGRLYEVLDAGGNVVYRFQAAHPDSSFEQLALTRQYRNPGAIEKLALILAALPETKEAAAQMNISADSCRYICYDEPSASSPWYHFGYEDKEGLGYGPMVQFLIAPDGRSIQHMNRDLNTVTPYSFWHTQQNKWE